MTSLPQKENTEDKWYIQNLPRVLLPLHERTWQHSGEDIHSWTVSEVLSIVEPLLGLRAEKKMDIQAENRSSLVS